MRWFVMAMMAGTLGCNGGDVDTDGGSPPPDTDDIPDTFLGRTEKPSDVEREGESLTAGLIRVTVGPDDAWELGGYLGGAPITGTGNFGIELPEKGEELDLGNGRTGALYLPVVYDDIDRDKTFIDNEDDLVLGFSSTRWLVYLSAGGAGDPLGWSVVDASQPTWVFYKLTEQSVVRLYGLSAVARLQGIYEGDATGYGVVALDERYPGADGSDWAAVDVAVDAMNGQFDQTIDSRPPVDAFQFPPNGVRYVRAQVQFFNDVDGNGRFSPDTDTLADAGLCFDGKPLILRFSDTPRSIGIARSIAELGWTTGWRFVTGPYGASTEVSRADLKWTRFKDDCPI